MLPGVVALRRLPEKTYRMAQDCRSPARSGSARTAATKAAGEKTSQALCLLTEIALTCAGRSGRIDAPDKRHTLWKRLVAATNHGHPPLRRSRLQAAPTTDLGGARRPRRSSPRGMKPAAKQPRAGRSRPHADVDAARRSLDRPLVKLEPAQTAFAEALATSRRPAEQDPSNAGWQRDLAVACWRPARVEVSASRQRAAVARYEGPVRIYDLLADAGRTNDPWSAERTSVASELARLRQAMRSPSS
jgi:hypothetical protein